MTKTVIIDPRVPLGKHYVDLTVDEVLKACAMYLNDKQFEAGLAEHLRQHNYQMDAVDQLEMIDLYKNEEGTH